MLETEGLALKPIVGFPETPFPLEMVIFPEAALMVRFA